MDPRVAAVRNELQSSLELQLKISALLGKNLRLTNKRRKLRERLADLDEASEGRSRCRAAKALEVKVSGACRGATRSGRHPNGRVSMHPNL